MEKKIVGMDTFKRDVHGVTTTKHPTTCFHWTVNFGDSMGLHDCDDKVLTKDPASQKKPRFLKMASSTTTLVGTTAGENSKEQAQQSVSLCQLLQEQLPGYFVDGVKLSSDPLL